MVATEATASGDGHLMMTVVKAKFHQQNELVTMLACLIKVGASRVMPYTV